MHIGSLRHLAATFIANSGNNQGVFDFVTIEKILSVCGLFCARQELTKLVQFLTKDASVDSVHFGDLLRHLEGTVNEQRKALIDALWAKLSSGETLDVNQLRQSFNSSKLLSVRSARKNKAQADREFAIAIDGAGGASGQISR